MEACSCYRIKKDHKFKSLNDSLSEWLVSLIQTANSQTSVNLLDWLIKKNWFIRVNWIRHTQSFQNWLHLKLLSGVLMNMTLLLTHIMHFIKNANNLSISFCFRVCCSGLWISDSDSWPVHTSWPFDLDLSLTPLKHRHTHTLTYTHPHTLARPLLNTSLHTIPHTDLHAIYFPFYTKVSVSASV